MNTNFSVRSALKYLIALYVAYHLYRFIALRLFLASRLDSEKTYSAEEVDQMMQERFASRER
jgi:uncharacterized membrane protein